MLLHGLWATVAAAGRASCTVAMNLLLTACLRIRLPPPHRQKLLLSLPAHRHPTRSPDPLHVFMSAHTAKALDDAKG